jgi:hypothetical protein
MNLPGTVASKGALLPQGPNGSDPSSSVRFGLPCQNRVPALSRLDWCLAQVLRQVALGHTCKSLRLMLNRSHDTNTTTLLCQTWIPPRYLRHDKTFKTIM